MNTQTNTWHTPGPWRHKFLEDRAVIISAAVTPENAIAYVARDEDCCLIAAAPELLEALINLRDAIDRDAYSYEWSREDGTEFLDAADRAIAKAKGAA